MNFQAYLITCLVNGKNYVGITSRGITQRWSEHLYDSRSGRSTMAISRAISKYGHANFSIQVVCSARSWNDICAAEAILIAQYGCRLPNGYNLSEGGEGPFGVKRSAESVERSAAKHRGRPCHENTRAASSLFHKGRPKSTVTRARMSASKIGTFRRAETKAKISAARIGRSFNAGMSNGHAKLTDEKVREARRRLALGESQRSIGRSLEIHFNAIWKIAHGLHWKSVL